MGLNRSNERLCFRSLRKKKKLTQSTNITKVKEGAKIYTKVKLLPSVAFVIPITWECLILIFSGPKRVCVCACVCVCVCVCVLEMSTTHLGSYWSVSEKKLCPPALENCYSA